MGSFSGRMAGKSGTSEFLYFLNFQTVLKNTSKIYSNRLFTISTSFVRIFSSAFGSQQLLIVRQVV